MCSKVSHKAKHIDQHNLASKISEQAARVKATLMIQLQGKYVSLTCDHWTSIAGVSYSDVNAHYVDTDWRLISVCLRCHEHTGAKEAADLVQVLTETWESYKLPTANIVGVVTDTVSESGLFATQLPDGIPHHYCVDHVSELTAVRLLSCHTLLSYIISLFILYFTYSFYTSLIDFIFTFSGVSFRC